MQHSYFFTKAYVSEIFKKWDSNITKAYSRSILIFQFYKDGCSLKWITTLKCCFEACLSFLTWTILCFEKVSAVQNYMSLNLNFLSGLVQICLKNTT